ncbi:16S rRNA (cytidine(1402)-2'-O)-methyltransferase [Gilvimarinus chinensis]|uniref:16S rRNA (cytidine(1402)-2'-O)-methyltransferase n=1 Tax=Gilvimarinus chinensis TaxID=396005 RepID=UPI0004759FA6|nr:16S rRNA (cytidine(1402)-2'-O)-methyltransferase [Gilvimarinus chinensis]
MQHQSGVLYVVATPIGNLADMVPRAVTVLQMVNVIACEDTRHSARLLQHFSIETPCVAYHDHSDDKRVEALLSRLQAGDDVALISDAGTPLVSDPGYRLVRRVREQGVKVVPVPGACAFVAALSAAGLPSDRFVFEGFLPAKPGARLKQLQSLSAETRTLIFYEAPHRVLDCVQDMVRAFGPEREVVLARELSKAFETIHGAPVAELARWIEADSNQQRGEIVLLVRAACGNDESLDDEVVRTMEVLLAELPLKQAAQLGAKLTGLRKNELYQWALGRQSDKS